MSARIQYYSEHRGGAKFGRLRKKTQERGFVDRLTRTFFNSSIVLPGPSPALMQV
jgi:hypothetical protein